MVKMGDVSGATSAEEAIGGFSHHFDRYKNFRAVQVDSKYKVHLTKKNGTSVDKLIQAGSAEDARRIALRRNRGSTSSWVKLWRKVYVVFADPK